MSSTDAPTAQQKTAEKSRPARERVLPVAQIYRVMDGEAQGRSAMITLLVGDENCPPKKHGIRASHADWVEIFRTLSAEDAALGEQLRAATTTA